MKSITFDSEALDGLQFNVPPDPIPADVGEGPAYTVHLLPNQVTCEEVVFAAEGVELEEEGYWIHLGRLRLGDHWVCHLADKMVGSHHEPAVVMLARAFSRKRREMMEAPTSWEPMMALVPQPAALPRSIHRTLNGRRPA